MGHGDGHGHVYGGAERSVLENRYHHCRRVVPALESAVVARDLAVREKAGHRDLAEHLANGHDLALKVVLQDHPAAHTVEHENACGLASLEVVARLLGGRARGVDHRLRIAVEDADQLALPNRPAS